MDISVFYGLPKKGEAHLSDEVMSIDEFLNKVKYGAWKDLIEEVRKEKEKSKRDWLKKKLPSVTISGVFGERKESELVAHSGFICIDIDGYVDKKDLLEDKYTYALMKSSSGGGLAVVVKIKKDKHKESFKWIQNYYFKNYGITVDSLPQNVASLRYVSYDPELYLNEKSRTALTLSLKRKKTKSIPVVVPKDKIGEYIQEVRQRNIDIAPDYETYRNLGFALADGFGEAGRDYFYALASVSPLYDSRHAKRQYDECLKQRKPGGISVGTFYWMLKSAGINIKSENKRLVHVVTMGKEAKRKPEDVIQQLVQLENIEETEAKELVDEVFSRKDIDINKAIESPGELIEALMRWLQLNHPLRKNEITGKIEDGDSVVSDDRLNYIYLRARMFFDNKDVTKDIIKSIVFSEFTPSYNPINEYIENNKFRKSEGNIDQLIKTLRTDNPMKAVFVRKWLLSIIAASEYNPVRSVLALIGPQNCGKSEWFRRLLPEGLSNYYAESKLDAGKDDELLMCQKLVLIDDEMGGKSKQDEKRFKELTSKRVFSLRAPYKSHNEDYRRLAILGGTSNESAILNDPTGNSRILPLKIDSIDHELYNSIDKDELFMELYRCFKDGEEWQLTYDELAQLNDLSGEFEQVPFERELIQQFFKAPAFYSGNDAREFLTSVEIKEVIEERSNQKIMNIRRFQSECTKYFGSSKLRKISGEAKRCYEVVHRKDWDKPNLEEDEELPF